MKTKKNFRRWLASSFTFSWRDALVTLIIFAMGVAVCALLRLVSETDSHVPLIFVLVVLMISLSTDGYLYGLIASVLSVFGVNYAFTFPYFHLNFQLSGYPLTFLCMFVVTVITCTLMSRVRRGEQARMDAEREKMHSNLLRAISHDFRTPLTSIIGTLSLLQEKGNELPENYRATLLTDAKDDAEWLINIMENILSITRFGTDSAPVIHTEPQACEEVASEAVTRFRKQYPDFRVEIHIPDDFLMSPMDAMLIEQVIINLLINTVLHGKTATCAILSLDRAGNFARFSVEDNGKGISRQAMEHLFDGHSIHPHDGSQDSNRNMGIGLSVCRTIIRAHGGAMSACNRPEGGARFTFTLPLTEDIINGNTFEDFDS